MTLHSASVPAVSEEMLRELDKAFPNYGLHSLNAQIDPRDLAVMIGHRQVIEWIKNKAKSTRTVNGKPNG